MNLSFLIADSDAAFYEQKLASSFLDIRFIAAADEAATRDRLPDADALLTFGLSLDRDMVGSAPKLRWIQALSTGTDRFIPLLAGSDIVLTSARGAHGAAVSELAFLLMLSLARRLPEMLRQQQDRVWKREGGSLLAGKTLGIAGVGVIGQEIAARGRAFGMRCIGFGSSPRSVECLDAYYRYSELAERAPELDMLVVVAPLTPQTSGLVDKTVFEAMKPSAFLINVGRGAVVDDAALVSALSAGTIAGAGLDVFAQEPLPTDSPLWTMENVVLTPHIGGMHDRYGQSVLPIVEHNLREFSEGRLAEMINRVSVDAP